jgi:hypothetical protein
MNMFFMSKAQRNNLNATQSTNNFMGLRTNTLKQIVNAQTVVAQHPQ